MEIRRVGVLGAGAMGIGVAEAVARAGFETILAKATPGPIDAARERLERFLEREVEGGRMSAPDRDGVLERLQWTSHLHSLAGVDIVLESVLEDLAIKQATFRRLDEMVESNVIFATNTSTLCIAEIATAVRPSRQERFIGMHFLIPVHTMKLVEIAPTFRTSQETVGACTGLATRLGKSPVVVADSTGFIVNRLLVPFLVDAIASLQRGIGGIGEIDAALQSGANHPMGPLALADLIGLDVVYHMATNLQAEYGEARFAPPPLLRRMVLSGYLGRKTRSGFYDYAETPPQPNDWLVRRRGC